MEVLRALWPDLKGIVGPRPFPSVLGHEVSSLASLRAPAMIAASPQVHNRGPDQSWTEASETELKQPFFLYKLIISGAVF